MRTPHYTLIGSNVALVGEPAPLAILRNSDIVAERVTLSDGGAGGAFSPGSTLPGEPMQQQFSYSHVNPGTYAITATIEGRAIHGSPLTLRVVERKPPTEPSKAAPMPVGSFTSLMAAREQGGSPGRF